MKNSRFRRLAKALPVIRSFCDALHRSLDSCGMRSVYDADPDPYENTKRHNVTEVHEADK